MASGNYIQNFSDVLNMVSGRPLDRPVQNSTLDSFSNSRGSMSTKGAGGGLTTTKVKTVDVDKNGNIVNLNPEAKSGVPTGSLLPPTVPQYGMGGGSQLGYGGDAAKQIPGASPWGNPTLLDASKPAKPGGIYPAWVSRAKGDYYSGRKPNGTAMLPVETMTPELAAAYADIEAGKPGAGKNLANLLADQAQAGNIGTAPVSGGGIKIGSGTQPGGGGGGTIRGSNTGKTFNIGQRYEGTNGYVYEAQPNGQFFNQGYSTRAEEERKAQGQAIGDANRRNPNPTYSKSGENNSFMPRSYQNSVRQQTGY